jgi:hypothetical protein
MLNNPKLNKDVFEITQILLEDSYTNNMENKNKNIHQVFENHKENSDEKSNIKENKNNANIIFTEINESNNEDYNKNESDINSNNNNINEKNIKEFNITKNTQNDNIFNYNKEIKGLISKYEEKIDLLMNENNILKEKNLKQKLLQDNLLNENIILEKEIKNLKEKINEDNDKFKELLSNYNHTSKMLIDLENKNNILENENHFLKKSLNEYSNNIKYSRMNSNNFNNQKIKMYKNIEKILKENNDNSYENKNIHKIKLDKSETQFLPNNIMSYKDLKKDCNFFRKRNISNIGTLRTEPNKFEKINNMRQVSSIKYFNNENNKDRDSEEQSINKKSLKSLDFNYFPKEKNFKNFHKNYSSNMLLPSISYNKFNKNVHLKKEIEDLDEEILEIQSRIKEMLHEQ